MSDDTFDNPLLGEPELSKLPPLRTFKVSRPGREDIVIEAHAMDHSERSLAFIVLELPDGKTAVPRIRHLIIAAELEVVELVELRATPSRIIQ